MTSEVTFSARARTLDMLGRQQIAGIPTAISELFKNAHDAYAERAEIDFFRSDRLFVLRDDGMGMTRDQFADRWLTIATETSVKRKEAVRQHKMPGRKTRPILGEKGIGRLAIATIAPQVLVLTRPQAGGPLADLTAAFLNWRVFESPELNLRDIRIPLRTFRGGTLPDAQAVKELVAAFRTSNSRLHHLVAQEDWANIETDLAEFAIDPQELDSYLGEPSLGEDGHGTHFYLLPAYGRVTDDIDGEADSKDATPLQKTLLGFTTPPLRNGAKPSIRTAFRDHKLDGTCVDHIGEREFFTRYDYDNADHRIWGSFDEYGQFKGGVSVYGDVVDGHVINWQGGKGRPTACGPFRITFAAIEGAARQSTLPSLEHARIQRKTSKIGGLYIYRDGVRIQPYGNTDYDWLEIEMRRTKSAAYYYFSYRQMFGFVEIDSDKNRHLHEKAGREGFQVNKAYRQFRSILKSFLVQVAADFFREEGVHGERFASHRRELKDTERHRRTREKKVKAKRTRFRRDLATFFERNEQENPLETVMQLGVDTETRVRQVGRDPDRRRAASNILQIERDATRDLRSIEARYRVSKPRIGMSRALQKEWRDYQEAFEDIQGNIRDIRDSIESVITEEVTRAGVDVSARARLESALDDAARMARREVKKERSSVEDVVTEIVADTREVAGKCVADVDAAIRAAMADFNRRDLVDLDDDSLVAERETLEGRIHEALEKALATLDSLRSQLVAIDRTGDSSLTDQLAAVEQSNLTLREQAATDLQLAQLGMAIEIISHEFGAAIRTVRSGLRTLKAWADANTELTSLYRSIRGSFDHLDGYLTLFTPLQRRLYRKAVDIHGWEIHQFLVNLFGQRMARHDVEMVCTDAFANAGVRGFPSSFYPVFANLVDNSLYWLSGQNKRLPRSIKLDAAERVFRVSDTGPGIHDRDREEIFDMGFTRKPGGRGMGLAISRETLREAGYDLILEVGTASPGTTFLIRPTVAEEDESDGS